MKKILASLFACIALCLGLVACSAQLPDEIVGRYVLTSASGTVSGVTITKDTYEYFELILEKNGSATVRSKGSAAGSPAYEATGTAVYEDGKIKFTTTNGSASATEEYDYSDGVITYTVDAEGMSFRIVMEKVTEE